MKKMMKVAIAGTNGFAQYLAYCLETSTPHQFIILSRRNNAGLSAKGWQVIPAKYDAFGDLVYLLTGVDIVISTISGPSQLTLIDAAAAAHVTNFVPSEFREPPFSRAADDPSDNDRLAAIARLQSHARHHRMNYTIFSCGLFYERFGPGGLSTAQIDVQQHFGREGEFLVDIRKCRATVPTPVFSPDPHVCLTSARDAARMVIASLELRQWPTELTFQTERLSVRELIRICQRVRGEPFRVQTLPPAALTDRLASARGTDNKCEEVQASQLLSAAEGRFDFSPNMFDHGISVECEPFEQWLHEAWKDVLSRS